MITKEHAIYNVAKAYLEYKILGRLFWDDRSGDIDVQSQTRRDYFKADARFETMGAAYMDAGLLVWADIDAIQHRYFVENVSPE